MRQNKFTKIQFDIADDGITNRSTIGGKAWVFEPVQILSKIVILLENSRPYKQFRPKAFLKISRT
ncbi:hypothetical protein LEP1GSC163_3160 [Leptospira santarosai str. CBC379]|uniref:hypothetical protein n=1 Tax=Leptospira santarosai TaxID=28183 RepID=UPI0002976DA6|nr:hypothetical protein LEP1GSC163_3160 [Leptospira santarosai str. CBC379]